MLTGTAALVLGFAYYVFARPPGSTVMPLPSPGHWWHVAAQWPVLDALPSLLHVFAFSLLTVAVIGWRRHVAWLVPGAWLLLDAVFEGLQAPPVRAWLDGLPLSGLTGTLPAGRGTFDPLDLAALFVGAALAGVAIARMESNHETGH